MTFKLNLSIRLHTIIGALISFWSFIFIVFVRPFEHGQMDIQKWIYVGLGFSTLTFVAYAAVILYQNLMYKRIRKWNVLLELSTYLIFFTLYATTTFIFYRSPIINGFYSFYEFLINIIVNIFLILTPIICIARHYTTKLLAPQKDHITIKGDNKLDILKIKRSDLVCVSNVQNYVEIFYLDQERLKTKLIRTTLKKLQADFDFLLQIHRSHLINPVHFKSWKDSNTILINTLELPVSKNYKNQLLSL